ncbi:MAG: TetR/AcrR family transcriptional regulator [Myxococcales bacterium]|nr:TetR/AcrR family transcriptional regulator [Myxococcales bacterium]
MARTSRASKPTPLDPRRAATRTRIVEEATRLFSQYGFRLTSVDAIAAAAGCAKPTLYAHFPDKDALFLAVCEHVLSGILARAEAAATSNKPMEQQLCAALSAKYTYLFELVHATPHAAELLGSSNRVAEELVAEADRRFREIVRKLLQASVERGEIAPARAGLTVTRLADMLLRCGYGAGYHITDPAQHKKHLEELVRVILLAVRPEEKPSQIHARSRRR